MCEMTGVCLRGRNGLRPFRVRGGAFLEPDGRKTGMAHGCRPGLRASTGQELVAIRVIIVIIIAIVVIVITACK